MIGVAMEREEDKVSEGRESWVGIKEIETGTDEGRDG